ncbi:CHRD domain-containing protein [Pedobacter chinensis]|uniref:CHRD domain-containing protein n=1 Tax=Pedobacter chinensis TaxID=2282421 RepID=A0A369Q114_9SPHI|nr:CHRD domain-containing protein [Pedobacter chinensis]RDC58192.1 CHRD domain-containing protein [Pedobacter chinensis]
MQKRILKHFASFLLVLLVFLVSCKKELKTSDVYIKKQWRADLSVSAIVPQITGRTDHAVASIYLMDNNELHYYIYFDKPLNNGDTPGKGSINIGAAGTNGTLLINLETSAFNEKLENNGKISLNTETANALLNQSNLYLNVTSSQQPAGLVRGQL